VQRKGHLPTLLRGSNLPELSRTKKGNREDESQEIPIVGDMPGAGHVVRHRVWTLAGCAYPHKYTHQHAESHTNEHAYTHPYTHAHSTGRRLFD